MDDLLFVQNLSAGYGGRGVIQEISFELKRGEILGIVGESGSGKSTLFNAILGILPNLNLTQGRIDFLGQELSQMKPKDKRILLGDRIGTVFQNSQTSLVNTRRIKAQFEETVLNKKQVPKADIESRALDLFRLMNLPAAAYTAYPPQLSGGQRQRVAIALAMIMDPDLLLCDEPTSALDDVVEYELAEELVRLRDQSQVGIFLITHNIALAKKICDKILVLYKGRVVEYRPAQNLLENPLHPYSRELIAAVPQMFMEGSKETLASLRNYKPTDYTNYDLHHWINPEGDLESLAIEQGKEEVARQWKQF